MEFLKAFFGDKAITYDELVQAINAYNGDEKNKEKLIKMVNLTDGGYVSKDKYTNLETDLSGKTTELTKANNLIEELKKSAGKDEETQQKITAYETEIADLKKENAELKTENALKFALVAAGAVDVDYLVFKTNPSLSFMGKIFFFLNPTAKITNFDKTKFCYRSDSVKCSCSKK